jgi:hypothetical protein
MSDYPNMSYCMYQNTKRALQQILNDLDEAHEEGVTYLEYIDDLSLEEKYAMKELDNIFEGIQDILKEMRRSKAND